ncbi:MAG: tyrosine--tRNA ligase [Candidatus Saccharibacteria bacterium]
MKLSEELTWRGFVGQTTFDNISKLDGEPISFYFGVDPSSNSMTIGNLAATMMVRHFIDAGHKAHLLVGGATGMIGDPDGKANERNLKTLEEIAKNKAGIAFEYDKLFAGKDYKMVDNYDWFKDITFLDFLRDVGKRVPLNQMLGREFVQSRLGAEGDGMSYAEFSYALIQGYDFVHLFREYGVTLQICGSDQWGNAIAGVDLIRRMEGAEADIYSIPLVMNKATGAKFGKSEEGAVWLNPDKTSVYKFYQFWLNVDDGGAIDYMKIYTLLDQDTVKGFEAKTAENPGERAAQKALAYEVTKLVHGQERTESVMRVTDVLFGDADFKALTTDDLDALSVEIPVAAVGKSVIGALVESGLAGSNGEARRLIDGNAVSVNGEKITVDFEIDTVSLIKKGKNSFILVR